MVVTVLALSSVDGGAPLILAAVDHVEFGDLVKDVTRFVADAVADEMVIDSSRVMIALSHTHSSPWFMASRLERPGGDLLEPYIETMRHAIAEASREALQQTEPATLTWGTGHCDLATNRDLVDPADPSRYLGGYNPAVPADDTVLVARVTRDSDSEIIGSVVNYACHPTALGWENRLVSPDYVGAMREVVEGHTGGAPCVFLQGASGELAPAYQYGADTDLADRHGRWLGYAVVSVLEGMLAPGMELAFSEVVESGAPLAVWRPRPFSPDETLMARKVDVEFPVKHHDEIEVRDGEVAEAELAWARERLVRKRDIARSMGDKPTHETPAWIWRVGDAYFAGQPNEAYSAFQTELRDSFPGTAIAALNLVNDSDVVAYLSPKELAGLDLYQVWQSPYGPESLDRLIAACRNAISELSNAG